MYPECDIKPDILNAEDIMRIAPPLARYPGFVDRLIHWLWLDRCNEVHRRYCSVTGVDFARLLVNDVFRFRLRVDNEEVLARFPEGPFITVSNHPFGSYDGIILLDLVGKYRPEYKVMVNMFLNHIGAMRPAFIAVDPLHSDNPEKKKITLQGIREAMTQIRDGKPLGFFPAGAVSKLDWSLHIRDRRWQPTVIRLIQQANVPVIPIFFHGHNSIFFNILGVIDWRLRTLRLPRELFNRAGKEVHVSIGEPIMPDVQRAYKTLDQLGTFLRERTYSLQMTK